MTRWRLVLLATLTAIALSGCLRFSADIALSPDNTVSGEYIVAVKQGSGDSVGLSDKDLATELWGDYSKADVLTDVEFSDYASDGYIGVTVKFVDAPLATFAPQDDEWGIERIGDEYVVAGPSNAVTEATTTDNSTENAALDTADLEDSEFTVAITFPGAVTTSNGVVTGRTVTWHLQDGPAELQARGSAIAAPDRATPLAWFALLVIGAGGIAYAFAGRLARRHR